LVQDVAVQAGPPRDKARATYEAIHARLWRALLAYSGSADVADDAVAEAFAQLLRRGDEVRDPAAWVWRSAFRIAGGELQRRGRTDSSGEVPDVGIEVPEPAFDLIRALQQLSDQQRRCVVLCDLAGHTSPEAGRLLGTTAATVRVQLMRGRRRLRQLLEDNDD
jgi:RNA polymerase sigma-70 factor (ECF subfamily)